MIIFTNDIQLQLESTKQKPKLSEKHVTKIPFRTSDVFTTFTKVKSVFSCFSKFSTNTSKNWGCKIDRIWRKIEQSCKCRKNYSLGWWINMSFFFGPNISSSRESKKRSTKKILFTWKVKFLPLLNDLCFVKSGIEIWKGWNSKKRQFRKKNGWGCCRMRHFLWVVGSFCVAVRKFWNDDLNGLFVKMIEEKNFDVREERLNTKSNKMLVKFFGISDFSRWNKKQHIF